MTNYVIRHSKFLIISLFTNLSYYNYLPVSAKTKIIKYPLRANSNQNFSAFIQAELLAKNAVIRELNQTNITTVNIKVVGEHNEQQVPLLFTKVTRKDWQTETKISR